MGQNPGLQIIKIILVVFWVSMDCTPCTPWFCGNTGPQWNGQFRFGLCRRGRTGRTEITSPKKSLVMVGRLKKCGRTSGTTVAGHRIDPLNRRRHISRRFCVFYTQTQASKQFRFRRYSKCLLFSCLSLGPLISESPCPLGSVIASEFKFMDCLPRLDASGILSFSLTI
jgi:hypothetical protein